MEKYVPYQSYLLRLWPTRRSGVAGFRVSLESVATGERRDFPDLERLLAFLQAQEEENLENSEDTSDGPQRE
jgi:hypothetical protein